MKLRYHVLAGMLYATCSIGLFEALQAIEAQGAVTAPVELVATMPGQTTPRSRAEIAIDIRAAGDAIASLQAQLDALADELEASLPPAPPAIGVPTPPPPEPINVLLTWSAVTENEDGTDIDDLAGYRVYFGAVQEPWRLVATVAASELSTSAQANASEALAYVTAFDETGNESAPSKIINFRD